MKQKQQSLSVKDHSFKHMFFNMIYRVNRDRVFNKQTNVAAYIVNLAINLLIFLSLKQIKIVQKDAIRLGLSVQIALFSIFLFTILQFLVCLIYKVQFFLAIQFKISRFVIFPLGLTFLLDEASTESDNFALQICLAIIFIVIVFTFTVFFQSQSFTDNQLNNKSLPITSYMIFVEIMLYCIEITSQRQLIMLLSFFMVVCSVVIKTVVFSKNNEGHIQHKILSIGCFLYGVYPLVIVVTVLGDSRNVTIILAILLPIVLYYCLSQLIKQKAVPINFKRMFNQESLTFQQFALYAQYLIDEIYLFNQMFHQNFCQSLIFTFYSQHQRYCQKAECRFFSQNWKEQFKNLSDPKTMKKLTQKVVRQLQILFQEVHKNQPDNIELKLSFIKFYIFTLPNKIKVLELISEIQNMNRTTIEQYEVYKLKVLSNKIDSIQVIDNLKIDEEVNQFQRIAYLTINSMMQFWLHFSQQTIDLPKVMITSQRLLSYKKQMQIQWQRNKSQEKYSTLKIVLLYSYYLRQVLHDQYQADCLDYFARALEEKLLHKKQIKYLSFGSEAALIGASLTDSNLGRIVIANNQASNVFNYSKMQINKIGLNEIMPRIFAEQHDNYLMQFHKNKFKRINSDERLLFGKDKFGHIIPIQLQLQRTICSMSQELLFIANIRKCKVKQTPLICITDQEGEISDVSSGFREVFYEKKQRSMKHFQIATKNVQEIIPAFFEISQPEDCGNYKFTEKFSNAKYGEFTIQFTVTPVSFPLKHNGGFVVVGQRQVSTFNLPLDFLNITKQIASRMSKQELQGHRVIYNGQRSRYQVDSFQTNLLTQKDQIYTIPYINIHDMTNIFDIAKEQISYGQDIKTLRLMRGSILIRTEINDTFESQQISQTQKVNRFQFKLKQLKYYYLQDENNLVFITLGRIFVIIASVALCSLFIVQLHFLSTQTDVRSTLLKQVKYRYQVRGYLSEYILSYHGLQSNYNNSYFLNKTLYVRDYLVDVIEGATIEQTQKQPILKTVFLKNQTDLRKLITSETLTFRNLDLADVQDIMTLWIVYIIILSIFLIFQILIKFLHSQKIHGVYHVFLGVDERIIKKSYDSCLKFSQMLEQKEGQQKKLQAKTIQDFDDQNQNPVSRMKKYKQNSSINLVSCAKFYLSLVIIICLCIKLYIMIGIDVLHFNKQIRIFNSVYGLFPQSSIALMNSYFKSYIGNNLSINQTFNSTYQAMDSIILQYQNYNTNSLKYQFFNTFMNNACKTTINSLETHYAPLCETVQQSIFVTGLSKVTNHIAQCIQNINSNARTNIFMDLELFELFQIQYDFYVPMITKNSNLIHSEMVGQISSFQKTYTIWMGILTLIIAINSFYIYQILLSQIKNQIQLVKQLLHFIPDSFIDEKTTKFKKKHKRVSLDSGITNQDK